MAKIDSLEASLLVNGSAKHVFDLIESSGISRVRGYKIKARNPEELYLVFGGIKSLTSQEVIAGIKVTITQEDANLAKVFMRLKETKTIGASKKEIDKLIARRSSIFSSFVTLVENACSESSSLSTDVSQIDDIPSLMAMTEATGSSDGATMRLIEIAKHHEESGNQVEALLILAPLAAKYCIPAIDALTRISAEKGDMAGLQSWSAKKAEAMQIVSSGHGSAISGV